eukprot:TRINITY_DN11599_c0_g1_i1.p1 TRINITY_DN11599_c0_g1~~TRINITY_DN11599_c0_g1_i1.p1  ORF type:complete len:378 (-),score=127.92 TRINITY_DN11599_c0_g1_i1:91-1224(-)
MSQRKNSEISQVVTAIVILEKDTNDDILPTWIYPHLAQTHINILIARSPLSDKKTDKPADQSEESEESAQRYHPFIFSKYHDEWHYIYTAEKAAQSPSDAEDSQVTVAAFSICLISKSFFPEKYQSIGKIFADLYESSNESPLPLLDAYLSIITNGSYENGEDSFIDSSFNFRKTILATSIKEIIKMFGVEIILIWTALITKKRIVVYSDSIETLQLTIRGFPQLIWHRQDWNILRPYVTLSSPELDDLNQSAVYCAGFTDPEVRQRVDLYDIFVDINALGVTVSESAKGDFLLGSIHKELATFLVESSENPDATDQQVIKGAATRTYDLLSRLESMKTTDEETGRSFITFETIHQHKFGRLERFLFNVAAAEGMTQ